MKFVLIWILTTHYGVASSSAEFDSLVQCQNARDRVAAFSEQIKSWGARAEFAECFTKGDQ